MTPYELTDLAIGAMGRLDMSWALFLSVHAALFGGIVYVDRPLRHREKTVLITAYVAIAGYNYHLTRTSQKMLSALYEDITTTSDAQKIELRVLEYFDQMSSSAWGLAGHTSAVIIHLIALVVVIGAILLDKPLQEKSQKGSQ